MPKTFQDSYLESETAKAIISRLKITSKSQFHMEKRGKFENGNAT